MLVLTSLEAAFDILIIIYSFYKTSSPNEEVNRIESSFSVSVPCLNVQLSYIFPVAPLQGRLLALLMNMIHGWKGLPETNTRALLQTFRNYARNFFIT